MTMTPAAKQRLSTTIRWLRARLLEGMHNAAESAYQWSVRAHDAALPERFRVRRQRLEAWLAEQVRTQAGLKHPRTADDFRRDMEKQAAYTLLNRLVLLRLMEAGGLHKPLVVTGGWESPGYKDFRELAPELVRDDPTEGYQYLLQLIFEDLAVELPGLYGSLGLADLIPVLPSTLREVIEALDDPELASCWTDDMTLGWVYQYWNDPERETLDKKISDGGKIEPHEIASKTQMFTERYMVDWLLQNSLGPMWLAICRKHRWVPEVQADGTLDRLEQRRVAWRAKRDERQAALATAKERQAADPTYAFDEERLPGVSLTALMPLDTDAERHWAYYVPQPIPDDAIDHVPDSVRDLKILDPAVGSGHFLIVAFELLVALYQEEARQRGETGQERWTDRAIVERILSHNLYGIDLDPRAVQIAAAALWLKARQVSADVRPERVNLVASNLRLASLADDDPALLELRRAVEAETGVPAKLTDEIVHALRGADHLGSLLKMDAAVDEAIRQQEAQTRLAGDTKQRRLFDDEPTRREQVTLTSEQLRSTVLERIEEFLTHHTSGDDLGLRLRGEQLAAGVRFVRLLREGSYDLVVGNPPYQGTSKMADSRYVANHYRLAKADLFAAFLLRGLELVREYGVSALLTMRNWMFIKQYSELRQHLLSTYDLRAIGDFDRGAFEEIVDEVVSVAITCFSREPHRNVGVALCPTPREDLSRDSERTNRKRAATLCHIGTCSFDTAALKVVPEWPLVYWWNHQVISKFATSAPVSRIFPPKVGLQTGDNGRFVRMAWEVSSRFNKEEFRYSKWVPIVMGAAGVVWIEPLRTVISWESNGLAVSIHKGAVIRNPDFYFRLGVAYATIGSGFSARAHRVPSVIMDMGSSVFPTRQSHALTLFNSSIAKFILRSLNPTVHFTSGDIARLPTTIDTECDTIFDRIDSIFTDHESHREPSVEFKQPGPSPWRHAQEWAQLAVDRPDEAPLPEYVEQLDPEPPTDHVSFALGVALGRFGSQGEGILDPTKDDLSHALPAGILFLDGTLDSHARQDGLGHPAARQLLDAWDEHGGAIAPGSSLREYLASRFFDSVHRKMYENRPIHWPLSSDKKTFVAWVTIHRWDEATLRVLLADHLQPTLVRLEGELTDLRTARDGADKQAAKAAEKRLGDVRKWRDELAEFIRRVQECAERGPPPTDAACPPREVDSRYVPDLDDGVMINSAALWPLLAPQWKDPKKWWKELASAKGKKDYDWSHLAMRYWPTRVDAKCQQDPSLGVAHGCFWKYHPARAWAWELRLQDEIGPEFRIDERPYRGDAGHMSHRAEYLRNHSEEALAAIAKEVLRRRRKKKQAQAELHILETGLWSVVPDQCWELEMDLILKQEADFHLRAPDEPEARQAFKDAHPHKVSGRAQRLANLNPALSSLFDDEDDEAAAEDDVEEDDDTEEAVSS